MYTLIDPVCTYFTGSYLFLYSCNIIIIKRDCRIIDKVGRDQKEINACVYYLFCYIDPVFGGISFALNKARFSDRVHLKSVRHNHAVVAHIGAEDVRDHLL